VIPRPTRQTTTAAVPRPAGDDGSIRSYGIRQLLIYCSTGLVYQMRRDRRRRAAKLDEQPSPERLTGAQWRKQCPGEKHARFEAEWTNSANASPMLDWRGEPALTPGGLDRPQQVSADRQQWQATIFVRPDRQRYRIASGSSLPVSRNWWPSRTHCPQSPARISWPRSTDQCGHLPRSYRSAGPVAARSSARAGSPALRIPRSPS
jgi:hypothetical protein